MIKPLNAEKIFTFYHQGGELLSMNLSGLKRDAGALEPILEQAKDWLVGRIV
jgi:hypothetical protein